MVDIGKLKKRKDVGRLIKALGDSDADVRWGAATALGEIGEPAVEPLITALDDEQKYVRESAAESLGRIGDGRAVEPLTTALGDEHEKVRVYAAESLGRIGDGRAVEPLIIALGDEHAVVRIWTATALGKIGDGRAVEPLITTLGDEYTLVRWAAAESLGKIGDPRAIPALEKATTDSDEYVRKYAEEALDKIKARVEEAEPKIILKSKSEYHGANIDFKVSIENQLDHSIADVKATLFVPQVFLLSEKEKTIGLIKSKDRQTTTFAIRPTGECGDCVIEGEVTYFDTASNSHERIKIEPKSVDVKCAILKRFKTEDDAWFDLVTNLISTKETHEEIPVPAEILFNVATDALRSMSMFMLEPVRNSAPGYFSGSARYAALGAAGGMKYAAQLNVIGSEAGSSRLVLEAWAEEESGLFGNSREIDLHDKSSK